jgi:hypothetical protein
MKKASVTQEQETRTALRKSSRNFDLAAAANKTLKTSNTVTTTDTNLLPLQRKTG